MRFWIVQSLRNITCILKTSTPAVKLTPQFFSSPPGHPVLHSDQDGHITVESWGCHGDQPRRHHAHNGALTRLHIHRVSPTPCPSSTSPTPLRNLTAGAEEAESRPLPSFEKRSHLEKMLLAGGWAPGGCCYSSTHTMQMANWQKLFKWMIIWVSSTLYPNLWFVFQHFCFFLNFS